MPRPIFTWYPDEGSSEEIETTVEAIKFGGYEQRITKGLNSEIISWDLTFTSNPTGDAKSVRDFLRLRGGSESFQWTTPLGEWGLFVCRKFNSKKLSAGILQVSAKFERVYEENV
jgi:phage-related protein